MQMAGTDAKFKEALPLYEKLKNEWSRKPPNADKTVEILGALKVKRCFSLENFERKSTRFSFKEFIC